MNQVRSKAPLNVVNPATNTAITLGSFTDKELPYAAKGGYSRSMGIPKEALDLENQDLWRGGKPTLWAAYKILLEQWRADGAESKGDA